MILLSGINHAALITHDLDRVIEFYTSVFGAEVVFEESAPELRHALLRIGEHAMLHPVEVRESPHGTGVAETFRRGHVDHFGLNVDSAEAFEEIRRRLVSRGASDGSISDLGPQLSLSGSRIPMACTPRCAGSATSRCGAFTLPGRSRTRRPPLRSRTATTPRTRPRRPPPGPANATRCACEP